MKLLMQPDRGAGVKAAVAWRLRMSKTVSSSHGAGYCSLAVHARRRKRRRHIIFGHQYFLRLKEKLNKARGSSHVLGVLKTIASCLFSFDLEWVPDPLSAEILFGTQIDTPQGVEDAMKRLWLAGGATEENPQPYLKTVLCRIVSVSGILREAAPNEEPRLRLVTLPATAEEGERCKERAILKALLKSIGARKPQLVGYNSHNADVPIIVQRAVVHGLYGQGMGERPEKPWQGADYFSTASEHNIDLAPMLGRWGQTPRLHEIASLSGIPGKVDTEGGSVSGLWQQGRLQEILDYNEYDAVTTHLLWARVAHFSGLLSSEAYDDEQRRVRELLEDEINRGKGHFVRYLEEWDRLRALVDKRA